MLSLQKIMGDYETGGAGAKLVGPVPPLGPGLKLPLAILAKWCEMGPRSLLNSNGKSHTTFQMR